MKREQIGNAELYLADARELLVELSYDLVVTDPPWDGASSIPGAENPRALFAAAAPQIAKARMAAVVLGQHTDPCFLAPLAERMSYFHTTWLRYVPASYRGRILVEACVGYVYGAPPDTEPGRRVIAASCMAQTGEPAEQEMLRKHGRNRSPADMARRLEELPHPMPRRVKHMRWLIHWHANVNDVVCDPFMGSGTTGVAAVQLGHRFVGVEIHPEYFALACRRLEQAQKQLRLA